MSLNALADTVRRKDEADEAKRLIDTATTSLLLGREAKHAFFAMLALRLRMVPEWGIRTADVDGKVMRYNPAFITGKTCGTPTKTLGLVVHEVMHCALCHISRRGARDPKRWNIAADLAINHLLVTGGFTLPDGGCVPGQGMYADMPPNLNAERYYELLPDNAGEGEGDDPGGCGGVRDAGQDAAGNEAADGEWQVAVAQAHNVAKSRGAMPAGLERSTNEILSPTVPWRDLLRRFLQRISRNDYAWMPPNRRYVHAGIYLPSLRSESLGKVAIAVDTSGSIGGAELAAFAGEVQGILEAYDVEVEIIYHDCAVHRVDEWRSEDGPLELKPVGGGGTSHRPVFEHVLQSADQPSCVICLTDGYTEYPDDCGIPTLWAMTADNTSPWGETVRITFP